MVSVVRMCLNWPSQAQRHGQKGRGARCPPLWGHRNCHDAVSAAYRPLLQHTGKDTFPGHDAVARLIVNGTLLMAFLADLCDLDHSGVAESELSPHRDARPVDPLSGNILREVPKIHIQPALPGTGNALRSQKAYLAMPWAG